MRRSYHAVLHWLVTPAVWVPANLLFYAALISPQQGLPPPAYEAAPTSYSRSLPGEERPPLLPAFEEGVGGIERLVRSEEGDRSPGAYQSRRGR